MLYVSLHRHDGSFFPGGSGGSPWRRGRGGGRGYTVNVGWGGPRVADPDYVAAATRLLLPIACQVRAALPAPHAPSAPQPHIPPHPQIPHTPYSHPISPHTPLFPPIPPYCPQTPFPPPYPAFPPYIPPPYPLTSPTATKLTPN